MTEIADRLKAFVAKRRTVSFVEMEQFLSQFIKVEGDIEISVPGEMKNVVLWAGMSQEFVDVFEECRQDLEPSPTHFLVYFIDGKALKNPIAKRPPKNGYKKEHWLPVVFNPKKADPLN